MFDIKSFYEIKSVEDVISAPVKDPNAEIIGGGTDVPIRVREGKDVGRFVVSIHNIEGLKGVKLLENDDLWIGTGISFSHITNSLLIQGYIPMLGETVDMVGGPQIHNTETIGGNICNGATSVDSASTMQTLEAGVVLEGSDDRRVIPVCEFYTGPGRTVCDRYEVCTCFLVHPEGYVGQTGHYMKYGKRKAMEIAIPGRAVRVKFSEDEKRIEDVRLGYGVAGPTSLRCRKIEEALKGCEVTDSEIILEFRRDTLAEVNPCSSWRASKELRLQLIEELSRHVLVEAIKVTGGRVNA